MSTEKDVRQQIAALDARISELARADQFTEERIRAAEESIRAAEERLLDNAEDRRAYITQQRELYQELLGLEARR